MTHGELFAKFIESGECKSDKYEAWQFGCDADGLAKLVLDGVKTATASAYDCYIAEGTPIPEPGAYSVILSSSDEALCVIEDTAVSVVPFDKVSERHAYLEGEDDRSLSAWSEGHRKFCGAELAALGKTFGGDTLIVCEEFRVVFRA